MSDDEEEYEYDYGSDEEYNYGSDNEEDCEGADQIEEGTVSLKNRLIEIENLFYEGDDLKGEDPLSAIAMFERVVELEASLGADVKWRFKALQYLVVMYYASGLHNKMVSAYRAMLSHISSVTRNESTEAINIILDALVSATDVSVLSEMYEITLVALKIANNDRLLFNTNLKLAKVYLQERKLGEVDRLVLLLKKSCQTADGRDDVSKGNLLLEVYSVEIQLCSLLDDIRRMKLVYGKTLHLNAAVADPRVMAIIREEGGKMQMLESNWLGAYNEFYESFRSYQEAGNARARDLLKYVVLASMLSLSDINPFAAREARAFTDDKEIVAMSELRQCLEANDLARFESTIRNKQNKILDEPFLMTYIQPLRQRMREQVLLNLTIPFKRVTISYLAEELSIDDDEVERLLVLLIQDHRLNASIDQRDNHLLVHSYADDRPGCPPEEFYGSLSAWANSLLECEEAFCDKIS